MKRINVIIAVLAILILAVIVSIIIYNKSNVNSGEIDNVIDNNIENNIQDSEDGNIFVATVVSKEENKIIVVPNKDELIYKSFQLLNVLINDNTTIIKNDGAVANIDDIIKEQKVKIEFDGKILSTTPTNIIATKIEIQ